MGRSVLYAFCTALLASTWLSISCVAQQQPGSARKAIGDYDFSQHGLQAVQLRYPNLTGSGLTVSIKEQPFDTTDIDFRGRVVASPVFSQPFTDHANIMTTLLGGAGNTAATSRGVAWGVRLASSSFSTLGPDTLPDLQRLRISVQNHSYGVGIERFYGPEARAYDVQTMLEPSLLHVFSSGNSGLEVPAAGPPIGSFATLTGEFKQAKNALVVGGVNNQTVLEARSSRGPTADGRIKPELVAYGNNGTSESAALVSGTAALLQQSYRNRHGSLPASAWVKACLIASAQDTGLPGPDHETGFGSLNALEAVTIAGKGQYQTGMLTNAAPQTFTLTIPPNTARFSVALAWIDPPAVSGATKQLREDLDLWLESIKTGEIIRPWTLSSALQADSLRLPARRGIDRANNVEQVSVSNPTPGTYRVWVQGTYLDTPQAYAVAYNVAEAMTWLNPTAGALLRAGEAQPVRWQWLGAADAVGTLAMQFVGDQNWQPIAQNVRLADQLAVWNTPDQNRAVRLRLSASVGTYVSDTCTLTRPTGLRVLLNCGEADGVVRAAVAWNPQPAVKAYQLYRLGRTYLEPLRQVSDTVAFLSPADGVYVAVAPLQNGRPGLPGFLIDYRKQGVGCYVANWLARLPVADTAQLDLTLSTAWNLTAITLERGTQTTFEPIQTIRPTSHQLTYSFSDRPTVLGPVRYRLRLNTSTGETILTGEETVYLVGPGQQLVFPNPVPAGEFVSVLITDSEVVGSWVTADGRRGTSMLLSGAIKQMPTAGLPPGLHLLQLTTPNGQVRVLKVLVR
ncbi:S8 family serine peptidase [uncultured Fibrella sp.]|uniref:S8 family serine peptidase n=1 Tax=uncultured Fibrella sp. TaxID=1284596 RepID=UPI0035C9D659